MRALFRMIGSDQSLNYHDYDLIVSDTNQVRAEDLYVYTTGEKTSDTVRRMFLQIAAQQNRGLLERLTNRDKALIESLPKL